MRSVHISVMTNVTLYSGSVTYSEILSICTISVMTLSMESSLSLATLTRWWSRDRLGTPDLTSISRSKLDSLIPAASPCRLPCTYNTEQCHLTGLIILQSPVRSETRNSFIWFKWKNYYISRSFKSNELEVFFRQLETDLRSSRNSRHTTGSEGTAWTVGFPAPPYIH